MSFVVKRLSRRALIVVSVAICAGSSMGPRAEAAVPAPSSLTVEHQARPLAVEAAAPKLGWVVNGADQSAYQVRVATSAAKLDAPDIWDSGKVDSSDSVNVPYGGPALPAAQRLWWSVRTWGDAASAWSAPASFGTAVKAGWQGQPIWTPVDTFGADYRIDLDFTVATVAAGFKFRASGGNSFMWQIRGDSSNELRPHVQVNGTYSQLKAVKLPMTIGLNTSHHLTLSVAGPTITTFIDGVLVDTTTDARNPSGSIGFRHGSTESSTIDNVKVTSAAGAVLYSNDFDAGAGDLAACGTVASGVFSVPRSRDCTQGLSDNWAFLRREFAVADKEIAWATAYVTARSTEPARQYVFKLSLNGSFVGVGPTRAKHDATATMYSAYDVTGLLRRGEANALGALAHTTTDKRFQAQLVIAYADGTRQVVASDGSWRTLAGEVALPPAGDIGTSYYDAPVENIDARVYPSGFDTAGFDDSAWRAPVTKAALPGLTGTPAANVGRRLRAPVRIVKKADGHYFIDFGRTVVGGLELSLDGAGGEAVEIRLGEELTNATTVDYSLRTGNTYRDVWTLRPGAQTLSLWGYRVFRYAEVLGAPQALTAENLKADTLVYPYDAQASSFASSSPELDQVVAFNRAGVRELNLDLHLDSPTRERAPYEGDNLIHMLIQGYTDGDWTLSRYTMEWLIENATWPTEWKFSSIESAREYWMATGDTTPLATYYDRLAAYLPTARLNADGLVDWSSGDHLVDWPAGERDGFVFTNVNTVINAWSYRAFTDMAEIAAALGKTSDAANWNAIATRLRAAINAKLYDPVAGAYNDGQATTHKAVHSSVFAVAFGVAGPQQLAPAAQYIADRGMACSVFCANFLVDALYDAGRASDALRMFTGTGTRSWLHMIEQGAGSPMEAWDPSLKSNSTFSHPWAGSPAYLVYRGALGIEALAPGYRRFSVKPQPGGLTHAEGVTPTVRGTIASAFAAVDGRLDVLVRVPANTTAVVTVPGDTLWVDHRPRAGGLVELGAGCHLVSSRGAGLPADSVLAFATAQGCETAIAVDGSVGGTVPATLSLTLGASASFGAFAPGVARTYEASTTATIVSTAGDAALSVLDPSATAPGQLVNGRFALAAPLQARAGTTAFAPLGSAPRTLHTYATPVSNDHVVIGLRQAIAADEPLRTGSYAKTLTFTLATTSP